MTVQHTPNRSIFARATALSPRLSLRKAKNKQTFSKTALSELSLHDQHLFETFGQGRTIPVPHPCIHHGIEEQVNLHPHAPAVQHAGMSISYQGLERQANRLAEHLVAQGVRPGDHVALFVQRSIPMVIGILAVLKVGAAYVPQDARIAPESQLRYVMDAAKTNVILTLSHLKSNLPLSENHTCIAIDTLMQTPFEDDKAYLTPFTPSQKITRDHTCFVLFTSGTTGNPNGVQVTHGNVCNILLTHPGDLGMRPGLKVGQILNIAFDMAAWEILGCLSHGATLLIRGKSIADTAQQADVIIATPTILSTVDASKCRHVQTVAVAGEPCPKTLADTWGAFCTFYNSCGPTETTIINTAQHYKPGEKLTIGKPTPNNTVYVLDENRQPCAIGEVGEMWAGGDCVSAGYIGNDTLNAERYAPDPFLGKGRMMFRTRDLGRWTSTGELEHLGRTDDQVKIRGFRVELDSVSAVLEAMPECKRAATLKLNDRDLVSFVSPQTVDPEKAKKAIAATLPYYCTPAFVLPCDELPMTSRGKVDKRLLLERAKEYAQTQEQVV